MVREHTGPTGSGLHKVPDVTSYEDRNSAETPYAGCFHMAPVLAGWYRHMGVLNFVKTALYLLSTMLTL